MLSFLPKDWGPQFHVSSGSIAHNRVGPNTIEFSSNVHCAVVLLSQQQDSIIVRNGERQHVRGETAGALGLFPANTKLFAEWRVPVESVLFALPPERMRQLAMAEWGDDRVEFVPPDLGHVDAEALKFAKLFAHEFRRARTKSVNQIYLDSLLTVFSTYLLRRYTKASKLVGRPKRGGLRAQGLRRVEDFIRANLTLKISIIDLAAIAGLSPTHFNRAFREAVGSPPHQYITILRLRRAEELSKDPSLKLSEIAARAGFSTHSQMTATMRQYWGVTPSALRRIERHRFVAP